MSDIGLSGRCRILKYRFLKWLPCNGVSCDIVSFLIPNPQHTVSLYTFIYQESAWSGRSGLSLRKYPETIELIQLNPRNMPIPRYYRLSVSTITNCPHDTSSMCCTILITSSSERGSIRRAASLGRLGLVRLGRLGLD